MKKLIVLICMMLLSFNTAYAGRFEADSSAGQIVVRGETDAAYETVRILVLRDGADINDALAGGSGIVFTGYTKSGRNADFAMRFKLPDDAGDGVYRTYAGIGGDLFEKEVYYENTVADKGEFPAGDNPLSGEVKLNMNTVTLSGNTLAGNTVTCMVFKPGYTAEAAEEAVCFAGQTTADKEGAYSISFDMDVYQPSGHYTAVISGNGVQNNVTDGFEFAGFYDAKQMVSSINGAASAAEVFGLMEQERACAALGILGCYAEDYTGLSEEQRRSVCETVYHDGTDYTDEENLYKSFSERFNEAVVIAVVESAANAEGMENAIRKYASYLGLDFSSGTPVSGASAETLEDIFSMLLNKKFESRDKLVRAVNEAELIGLIKAANHSAAEGIISYYKSLLQLDLKAYENLSDKTYVNKLLVSKEYIQKYSSAEAFAESVDKAIGEYKKYLSNQSSGGGGGSGGGGSSSGGIGGVYIPEPEAQPEEKGFQDLHGFEWARSSIEALADAGVVAGDENGNFNPGKNITREEFVKMVVAAFGFGQSFDDAGFSDSDRNKWYYPYVNAAFAQGIVKGISDTEFGAGRSITRQDIAVILARVIEIEGDGAQVFADDASIADYAKASVYAMRAGGIISGRDINCFAPADPASRAEAAVMIYNSLRYKGEG